jgi:hypothetical protein
MDVKRVLICREKLHLLMKKDDRNRNKMVYIYKGNNYYED